MPLHAKDLNTTFGNILNSFDSSKDRLDTKILIQERIKPSTGHFLSPQNLN